MNEIILKTAEFVKNKMLNDSSGHDWWHIHRVWGTSRLIAKEYRESDSLVIELAALLHDIADWKDYGGDFKKGPDMARSWLSQFDEKLTLTRIDQICFIIEHLSFKGASAKTVELALEGKIVQDADRLDATGAMGIARTFAFGGTRGQVLYDPDIPPIKNQSKDSYVKNQKNPSVNHFYEKLLLLKDRMNTSVGRKIAENRHLFMENFLNQFYAEWDGKC